MSKKKYWKPDKILATKAQYKIVYGGRDSGKSYAVKHYCCEQAKDDQHRFVYLRRRDLESDSASVVQYFNDLDIKRVFGEQAKEVQVIKRRIYIVYDIINTDRTEKQLIGYVASIAGYSHTAGENYNDVTNIIFEEFVSRETYLPDEPHKLQDFVSTVARDRDISVWMLGNTITRFCPYFYEWELKGVLKQSPGTIDNYYVKSARFDDEGKPILTHIAVERTMQADEKTKMIFGKSEKMITGGEWQADEKPHLPRRLETYNEIYSCVVEAMNFKFLCRYLYDPEAKGTFWYVERKTTEIKPNTRVMTDHFNPSPYYTVGIIGLSAEEHAILKELVNDNVVYSDNLTGTEFIQALKTLR